MSALPYPGITFTETDVSAAPTRVSTGVPAGIIGTAASGPAYVPLTFSTYTRGFVGIFGESGNRFGPIAVSMWLNGALNTNATYLRVLGAGDGLKRITGGSVNRAGFVVGEQQVKETGIVGNNSYAASGGVLGRTYFLGCYMSESAGSTYFSSAGMQTGPGAIPIIRGIIMTPSGVTLTLSGNGNVTNQPTTTAAEGSSTTGSIDFTANTFVMLLNGHVSTVDNPNVITASISTLEDTLNTDPLKLQERGHFLYSYFNVPAVVAAVTGSGILAHATSSGDPNKHDAVFITSSSIGRNTSNATTPNYEQFSDRFTHAKSPFVISQDFGGVKYDLFRVHSISDGLASNTNKAPDLAKNIKITISNISPATTANPYPTFSLTIDYIDSSIGEDLPISFDGLTLDPNSSNYIASVIGDQNIYFDFDRNLGGQKIAVEGDYPVNNNYIRIELSNDFIAGNVPADAIPAGFRGYGFAFTSGSLLTTPASGDINFLAGNTDILCRAVVPPIPVRQKITSTDDVVENTYAWGTYFNEVTSLSEPNSSNVINASISSYINYLPAYDTAGKKFYIDNTTTSDAFSNSLFTIENIQVTTGAFGDVAGSLEAINWASASYIRQGGIVPNATNKTRALQISDLLADAPSNNRSNVSFSFFLQGGFDGVNIFDAQKRDLTDLAAAREIDDSANQGGVNGPTVAAYRKAIDIMGSTSDVTMQLLAIPGIRIPTITNYAISAVESRFDALYLMDIQQKDDLNNYITSSAAAPSPTFTISDFASRGLNSSFAAAYFPDVTVQNPEGTGTVTIPPSAAVLSAYAKNDTYAPWYAPAGATRGTIPAVAGGLGYPLSTTSEVLGSLYNVKINPVVELSSAGQTVVWGQKTLLQTASSLDRINVRRLLIDIRRRVRAVANTLLFEPNTQATLAKFNSLVSPIMQDAQSRFGITRYKVVIDTSTTTQADIDNNTIRGKIFLQPVRTAEFISIDFTVAATSTT